MRLFPVWMLLCLLAPGLFAQAPTTGSASGRVLDADTQAPLSGVRVGSSAFGYATTDSEGRYTLSGLPPGRQSISIPGGTIDFLAHAAPRVVTVVAGRVALAGDFRVRLPAEISGRVLDEAGNPVQGVRVAAVSRRYESNGELESFAFRGALTDDRGAYRIQGLYAGRHYRVLAYDPKVYPTPISDAPLDPASRKQSLVATFYPNSRSLVGAVSVIPHSQEARSNLDIHMSRAPSYCVEATLTADGAPSRLRFAITEEERDTWGSVFGTPSVAESAQSGVDGKIRVCDLPPGRYRLVAFRYSDAVIPPKLEYLNTAPLTISDEDLGRVVVNALPHVTVSGETVWDTLPGGPSVSSLRFAATPVSPRPVDATVPGEFRFDVSPAIRYGIEISGLNPPLYIKDIAYGGSSIARKAFVPGAGTERLRITVGRDAGRITARVLGDAGQPAISSAIFILPANAQSEGELATAMIVGLSDDNGSYVAQGLPPGRYYVLATNNPPPSVVGYSGRSRDGLEVDRSPETMGMLLRARPRGQLVEVSPGGDVQVTLTEKILE